MTSKINSVTSPAVTVAGALKPGADKAAAAGTASASGPAAVDRVSLTGDAMRMQQLDKAVSQSTGGSEVDGKRVTQVRTALANGSYRIDSKRVADKLSRMEWDLGGK